MWFTSREWGSVMYYELQLQMQVNLIMLERKAKGKNGPENHFKAVNIGP